MSEVTVIAQCRMLSQRLDDERARGRSVGLVPTMGALHAGHASLIARAAGECDTVVVTVFVNPLQFDDPSDLAAYHRDLAGDVAVAAAAGARFVFAPSVEEMYPGFPTHRATTVHVAGLSECLEGTSRPGHFDGVATVVAKLFAMAGRCRAYFGEKDFQQLVVVRKLAADLGLPVEVVGCPIVRDEDGLALSSRNVRIGPDDRRAALALHRALGAGIAALSSGECRPAVVRAAMVQVIEAEPRMELDYAEVVDAARMQVPAVARGELRLLVAAVVGGVRLIDNVGLSVPEPADVVAAARGQRRPELVLADRAKEG